ncbi:MAG: porin family protein, partial [Rhizobiaceae bacterium]|nr:porin family protein [Rhizobiaceae bacterium]
SQSLDVTYVDPFGVSSSTTLDSDLWSGMINGYIDLGTYVGFTPYVGAGAGLVYARNRTSGEIVYPDGSGVFDQSTDNQFSFAYSLNAGASYAVNQNASIDVGYQYFSAPDAQYLSADNPKVVGEGVNLHQVKVGLRYDLW